MRKLYISLLGILLVWSCQNDALLTQTVQNVSEFQLITVVEQLSLQQSAGENSAIITTLEKGSPLKEMGAVSNFLTAIKLQGGAMEEPWLHVQTTDGQTGWVYSGSLTLANATAEEITDWRRQNRLQALFGKPLTEKIQTYRTNFSTIKTAEEFALVYQESRQLRDTMVQVLQRQQTARNNQALLNLFWLKEAFPAYTLQLVAEGTSYYLFENYKDWLPLAQGTTGKEDDHYIELCLTVYNRDSVEYFYPSWFIQTWDYGGHSLLGRGQHQKTLDKINRLLSETHLFDQQAEAIKIKVLEDIMQSPEGYWEKTEHILSELDSILAQDYPFLNDADKIGLKTRRQMFEQAAANKILVNLQSGE